MLKRSILILSLLLAFVPAAWATSATVAGLSVSSWQYGTPAYLRIYSSGFTASDGTVVPAGSPTSGSLYQQVACTVSGSTVTCPSFQLQTTSDALDDQTATYTGYLYDAQGRQRVLVFSGYSVPTSMGTPFTYTQWTAYNAAVIPVRDTDTYTKNQVNAYVASAVSVGNSATTTALGKVKMSVAPVDPSNPVAVGANDPSIGGVIYTGTRAGAPVCDPLANPSTQGKFASFTDFQRGTWRCTTGGWTPEEVAANVKDFGASGSGVTTTGSISSTVTPTLLTVANATSFSAGQYVTVAGAGSAGAYLFAKINSIAGNAFTLDTAAQTTVASTEVAHNDTYAFRALVTAMGTQSVAVRIPAGIYNVSGPIDATCNAAVCVTDNASTNPIYSIAFTGDVVARTGESSTPQTGAQINYSRLTGSGTYPAAFAARSYSSTAGSNTNFSYVAPEFHNLYFVAPQNPGVVGLQFHNAADFQGTHLMFDVGTAYNSIPQPTHPNGVAMILPGVGNHTQVTLRNVSVVGGFYKGIIASEATRFDQIIVGRSLVGISFEDGDGFNEGNYVAFTSCPRFVEFTGTRNHVKLNLLVERYDTGASGAAQWYSSIGHDIDAGAAQVNGEITYGLTIANLGTTAKLLDTIPARGVGGINYNPIHKGGFFISGPLVIDSTTDQSIYLQQTDANGVVISRSMSPQRLGEDLHYLTNASSPDGGTTWNRIDVSKPAIDFFLAPSAGVSGLRRAAAGANPITWIDQWRTDSDATASDTPFFLFDKATGTLKRVMLGAADSCGAGFRCLKVIN
jgi:hypothetical protein